VVDLAKTILQFFRFECCGKCTPCRIGTQKSYEIIERISEGKAEMSDLDLLQNLGAQMSEVSNCGLGQTASTAMLDILKHFRAEVEAHIVSHTCSVGVCPIAVKAPALL
jgi:NADP-reducing hydrogenase subunit HndC